MWETLGDYRNEENMNEGDCFEITKGKTIKDIEWKDINLQEGNIICIDSIEDNTIQVSIQCGWLEEQYFGNWDSIFKYTLSKRTYINLKSPHTYHISKPRLIIAKITRAISKSLGKK